MIAISYDSFQSPVRGRLQQKIVTKNNLLAVSSSAGLHHAFRGTTSFKKIE